MAANNEKIERAIKAIGKAEIAFKGSLIKDLRQALLERGYDEAIVSDEQYYLSADVNAELVRILVICRRHGLTPAEAVEVLDYLNGMVMEE